MTDVGHLAEIADGFLDVVDAVGNEVTKEKVKAIGARNRLQTIAKEREAQVNIGIIFSEPIPSLPLFFKYL